MSLPTFSMRDLMQAGVHFGHHPRRWNPKMAPYLFGVRNDIHIINLEQTVPMLYRALQALYDTVKTGGSILFVGTKRQAADLIAEHSKRCGQYYVNHRWLGGMLTNWKTVSQSIKRLRANEELLERHDINLTKKELLKLERERNNLNRSLGGIREMGGLPDMLIVFDTNKEKLAIREANALGIPVIAILDSNSDPEGVDYPIPGNDDAIRALDFYLKLFSTTILEAMKAQMASAGIDLGAAEELTEEMLHVETATEEVQKEGDQA